MAEQSLDDEKELRKKERKRAANARWLAANVEKNKATCALYYVKNKEKAKTLAALWQKDNSERAKTNRALWRKANPDKVKVHNRKVYLKIYSTPEGKLNNALRTHMRRCLLKTTETASQLKHSLPYTISELRVHLERQFLPNMSWANRSEWHIDHIIPLSSFKFTSSKDPEFQAAWALSNLRPMWAQENQVKNKKRLTLL